MKNPAGRIRIRNTSGQGSDTVVEAQGPDGEWFALTCVEGVHFAPIEIGKPVRASLDVLVREFDIVAVETEGTADVIALPCS